MNGDTLNEEQRIGALNDLLKYCRNAGHEVTTGLLLSPLLGVHSSKDGRDDARLAIALETLITEELNLLRRQMGLSEHNEGEAWTIETIFREDRGTNNKNLELLSLIWVHYFKGLPVDSLARIYDRSTRMVENYLTRGREEVARLVARREHEGTQSPQIGNSPSFNQESAAPTVFEFITPKISRQKHNRHTMLEKVRKFWITGVLERSLYRAVLIGLDMQHRPDLIIHPWDMVVQLPEQSVDSLPVGTQIIDVFDELIGEMLILGTPGAGKTTMLLELTRSLLERAEQNEAHPMPVVFNLVSWSEERPPLATWLVDELTVRYGVPRKIGQKWLSGAQVLPLLDGLDEVKQEYQADCVEAINGFRLNYGSVGLVVCSRSTEYTTLNIRLRLQGAVEIQPLTLPQVDSYLASFGENLAGLRSSIHADAILQGFAQTPLLLNLLVLTYQGTPIEDIQNQETFEERRNQLFGAYIQHMLSRRSSVISYERQQTIRRLAWLAYMMEHHAQAIFLIEWLQPNWLPSVAQRRRYMQQIGTLRGALVGLLCGVLITLALMSFIIIGRWPISVQLLSPKTALIVELIGGVGFAVILGLIGRSAAKDSTKETIYVVETLNWSGSIPWRSLVAGLFYGTLCGIIFAWAYGLTFGLLFGLSMSSTLGLLIGVKELSGTEVELEKKVVPNQGIRRSAYYAIATALSVGIATGSTFGMLARLFGGPEYQFVIGIPFGLVLGLIATLFLGGEACIKHFLLRVKLYNNDLVPWNYVHFLDYATERILLQKVGAGYIFIHPLLKQYLASLYKTHEQL